MLTKQAEAGALYSMVLHDLEKHYGLDLWDPMYISSVSFRALYFFEMDLEQNMQYLMT